MIHSYNKQSLKLGTYTAEGLSYAHKKLQDVIKPSHLGKNWPHAGFLSLYQSALSSSTEPM